MIGIIPAKQGGVILVDLPEPHKIDTSVVQILTKVKLKNTRNNAVVTYAIVPESEADLKAGKISSSTPIAKGLLGHKVGETVEIQIPSGKIGFEILEISL